MGLLPILVSLLVAVLVLGFSLSARKVFRSGESVCACHYSCSSVPFRFNASKPKSFIVVVAVSDPCPIIHIVLALSQVSASNVRFTILTRVIFGLMCVLGIGGDCSALCRSVFIMAKREFGRSVLEGSLLRCSFSCRSIRSRHWLVHVL